MALYKPLTTVRVPTDIRAMTIEIMEDIGSADYVHGYPQHWADVTVFNCGHTYQYNIQLFDCPICREPEDRAPRLTEVCTTRYLAASYLPRLYPETKCKHCAVKGTPQYLLHVHEPEHEKCKACGKVIVEDHFCTMTYHRLRCGKVMNEVDYGKHMKDCVKCLRSFLDHNPIVLAPTDSDDNSSDDE